MKAYFCSEERHLTVTICYSSPEKKKMIEEAATPLLAEFELDPEIFSFVDTASGGGELNIEFEDDYNEEAKPFLEALCNKLDLQFEYSCTPSCGQD